MNQRYEELFKHLKPVSPPDNLSGMILSKIETVQKRRSNFKLAILGSVAVFSLAGMIPSLMYVNRSLVHSGFYQYVSLAFSDSATLVLYWKEFSLSLVESLPIFGTILFLTATIAFLWSSSKAAKGMRTSFYKFS